MAISRQQMNLLKRYCREPIENIRGYKEALRSSVQYDCHHINELTFTVDELKMMNMYYDRPASELTLMPHSDHMKLHRRHDMPSALYGDRHPNYHKYEQESKSYKDKVSIQTEYVRAKKRFRRGLISEEELQLARDKWAEYQTIRRSNNVQSTKE